MSNRKESQRVVLWADDARLPSSGAKESDAPYLTVHIPQLHGGNLASVIICPGGGYGFLASDYEGSECAEWLNTLGVAAFVLYYRIAPRYHHPAPLMDVQRALRYIRHNSDKWGLDPNRIGLWGFSAGGHLASTAATHFDLGKESSDDPIDLVSCRPDFLILGYPVVTLLEPYTHLGSRVNLLGDSPDADMVEYLSSETQVTADTPPTFLLHTDADQAVPSENSVMFYLALRKAGVPAELHIFRDGPHGIGLASDNPVLGKWTGLLEGWLRSSGIISR